MKDRSTKVLFFSCGILYIIIVMYLNWKKIRETYVNNRVNNSIMAFWDTKNNPNFRTEQGSIYLTYHNPCYKKEMDTSLNDFYIFSAFRPYQVAGHSYDVCSLKGIQLALDKGARFHYIDVWSSNPENNLDDQAYPIVRNKTLMVGKDAIQFSKVCNLYKKNAWMDNNYPFLLYLNIHPTAQNNKFVLRKIARNIWKNFQGRFAPAKYSFSNNNIGEIPMREAMGKIIILTNVYPNDGFFQEMVNGVVNEKTQNSGSLVLYGDGHKNYGGIQSATSNMESIVNRNRTHLGIVIPDEKISLTNFVEPTSDLFQIPPNDPWKFGYHIVCVNLQKPSPERDEHIKKFKERSFVLKDDSLRNIPCPKPKVLKQNKDSNYSPRNVDIHNGYFSHNF